MLHSTKSFNTKYETTGFKKQSHHNFSQNLLLSHKMLQALSTEQIHITQERENQSTRKVKPIWILLKQETVSGSGISWAICKPAPHSRQITTPPLSVLQAEFPSCHPTNNIIALKATYTLKL